MRFLRSLLFAILFYGFTAVAVLLAIASAVFGRPAVIAVTRGWTRFFHYLCRIVLGLRARVEGQVPAGPVLVAAKHQSMFETLELLLLLGAPAIVVKRELAQIPLWGWVARLYGVIPVDRAGGPAALRLMLRAAREAMDDGRAILIFPEGTRVAPGTRSPLQPGFAGLYRALGVPVVPVALDLGRFWPLRRFVKLPGIATIRFGAPLPPDLPRAEIEAHVHAAINALEPSGPVQPLD